MPEAANVTHAADCQSARAQEPCAARALRYQKYLATELAEDMATMLADLEDELAIVHYDDDLLLADTKRRRSKPRTILP